VTLHFIVVETYLPPSLACQAKLSRFCINKVELTHATPRRMASMEADVICLGTRHTNETTACQSSSRELPIELGFEQSLDGREPQREHASRTLQSLQSFRVCCLLSS
jgi:hypothetical protein